MTGIRYQVRSRDIIAILNDEKDGALIFSPFFQRNLVWRDKHKEDFIETILKGFPFPQIFLARGDIDLEKMRSTSCVVDGQQRLSTIKEFVAGDLVVGGRRFSDLTEQEKTDFLRYEVAVIDFDLNQDDPRIIEIFKRLNRTFYALSGIEKAASEYASSEFMLLGRLLVGDLIFKDVEDEAESQDSRFDPNISSEFIDWARGRADRCFSEIINSNIIFSNYEATRKVPLMFALNIISTLIEGYFNRNDATRKYLDQFAQEFDHKDVIFDSINNAGEIISEFNLDRDSALYNKSYFFTAICELASNRMSKNNCDIDVLKAQLLHFLAAVPEEFALAAREGVNNRKERALRGRIFRDQVLGIHGEEFKPLI